MPSCLSVHPASTFNLKARFLKNGLIIDDFLGGGAGGVLDLPRVAMK